MNVTINQTQAHSLRAAGRWVMAPRRLLAAVLWLLIGAALPWPGGWIVLAALFIGTLACRFAESTMVRLLWCARRPWTGQAVPSFPETTALITFLPLTAVAIAGRHHLVMPTSWAGRSDLAAQLARARAWQLTAARSFDVTYRWLALPWLAVASAAGVIGRALTTLPLVGFAWRIRPIVTTIAIAQSIAAQRYVPAVVLAVVIGLTYLLPWTLRHHAEVVDAVLAVGDLGAPADPVALPLGGSRRAG